MSLQDTSADEPGSVPSGVPLSDICGHLLRRAQQMHSAIWLEEVGAEPTGLQYVILTVLAASPDIDQRRLGHLASVDKSSAADIVARLVDRGWLEKRRAPDDARRDMVALSPTAAKMRIELVPRVAHVQARLLHSLPLRQRRAFVRRVALIGRVDPPTDPAAWASQLRAPGHLIRRAQQVHTALFTEEFGRELTGPQYKTLHVLSARPGLSQRELGEHAALDTSTVADIVDRLVRRGWIARYRDPEDGRRKVLALTETAAEQTPLLLPRVLAVQERLLAPLAPRERPGLLSALTTIAYPARGDHTDPTAAPRALRPVSAALPPVD